jgi:X-Pro dipeptidyl-peptidase (S15 family)
VSIRARIPALFGAAALAAAGVSIAPPHLARAAATCPSGLSQSAHLTPAGGVAFTVCTGMVPSFDGTPLDVDVSIPDSATGALPLMVMMHGWGNSKTEFEATTLAGNNTYSYHWNNAYLTAQGYAVLNYTARGFHQSCGRENFQPIYLSESGCSGKSSWTHLADRRWEVHDTQYLAGVLVDDGVAVANKIAVTGDSYGGGQSWLLSLSQDQVMNTDGSLSAWTSPNGTALHIAAAVPLFTWTDLLEALTDNGRGSDGFHGAPANGDHTTPIGVEKQSYVDGLFALGEQTAQFAPPQLDPTADLVSWFAGLSAGEPYEVNPQVANAITQVTQFRSPYYMPVPPAANAVPVLSLQGVTDPLFPGIHTQQEINRLLAANASYPVWAEFGDIGHSYAGNPSTVWQTLTGDANTWLSTVLSGGTPALAHSTAATVVCEPGQSLTYLSGSSLASLATSTTTLASSTLQATTSLGPAGPEALRADPIVNGGAPGTTPGCVRMQTLTDPGVAAWTFTPCTPKTIVGAPVVSVDATIAGANAVIATRLWDVDPSGGMQTLITRSVYRFNGLPGATTLTYELWPTAWPVPSGHQLKLEVTQVDSPTWRHDNLPSAMVISGVRLTLPLA